MIYQCLGERCNGFGFAMPNIALDNFETRDSGTSTPVESLVAPPDKQVV
jgi:hypothetical protein